MSGTVWSFKANKGICGISFLREQLNAFNISMLTKELSQLFSCCSRREILNIEIASFLRVFITQLSLLLFNFSIILLEGFLNIKRVVLINPLIIQVINCVHCCTSTILSIRWVFSWFCIRTKLLIFPYYAKTLLRSDSVHEAGKFLQ